MSSSFSDPSGIDNQSGGSAFSSVLKTRTTRRRLLQAAAALPLMGLAAGCATPGGRRGSGAVTFAPVSASVEDRVLVPVGYSATPLYRWGDAIGSAQGMPAFKTDAGNTAEEQALQAGMHHDGMHFFPLPFGSDNPVRGLLAINHEYTDDGLLHAGGMDPWNAA